MSSEKPNVIIIICDALRPKDLSLYGRDKEIGKYLKRIASESILFKHNYSTSNASDPSVTSLFSGQYPLTTGFIHQHPFMRQEELEKLKKNKFWLPSYLKNNGYKTFSATPLHLWFKKGFDYFTDKNQLKRGRFLDIPFIKRILLSLPNWAYSFGKSISWYRASPEFYPCDKVTDLAISKINESDSHFFLFIHYVDSHYPYPKAKIKKINSQNNLKKILHGVKESKQSEYIKKRFFDISANCLEQIEKKRDESIIELDKSIWKLYSFLKDKKILDNTILFILSDHGDNFGEHKNYFCRGGLYEDSVHVPLILSLPGVKPRVIEGLTQTIDIAPTILDVLKEDKIKLDGKSLMKVIRDKDNARQYVISVDSFCNKRISVRTNNKKMILTEQGRCLICGADHNIQEKEEYDLTKDPNELINIYSGNSKLENYLKKYSD